MGAAGRLVLVQPTSPGLHHLVVCVPNLSGLLATVTRSGWLLHPKSIELYQENRQVWLCRAGVDRSTPFCAQLRAMAEARRRFLSMLGYGLQLPGIEGGVTLFRQDSTTALHVCYFDYDAGRFVVECTSRQAGYRLADMTRAYYTLFAGWTPFVNGGDTWIHELLSPPAQDWSIDELVRSYDPSIHPDISADSFVRHALMSATGIPNDTLADLCTFLHVTACDEDIAGALVNLTFSRDVFNGFMVPSYWESHCSQDVLELTDGQREKAYLEGRP